VAFAGRTHHFPGMLQKCSEITRAKCSPTTRFLAITGGDPNSGGSRDALRRQDFGADQALLKPFEKHELAERRVGSSPRCGLAEGRLFSPSPQIVQQSRAVVPWPE